MKYFTPELILQGRTNDHNVLDRHEEEWDRVCERYETYLEAVRPNLPSSLGHVLDSYYLHDAVIQAMGQKGNLFVIVLQIDTPPRSLLTLEYDLVTEPVIIREALPPELRGKGPLVDWQYDEIEMQPSNPATWVQSILLSNGWEVRLHFHDVQVQEVQSLLPLPFPLAQAAAAAIP